MYKLTTTDKIWNRAAMENGGLDPHAGDLALAAMLTFHGLVMNGGELHSFECCDSSQLSDAAAGYEFYGFVSIKKMISDNSHLSESTDGFELDYLELEEQRLGREYNTVIGDDEVLEKRFTKHFEDNPDDYAVL